jgi:hypothetical protein
METVAHCIWLELNTPVYLREMVLCSAFAWVCGYLVSWWINK